MIAKVLGVVRRLLNKATSVYPESSKVYDVIVTGRREGLTIFSLYRYGRLCGNGLVLDEAGFISFMEDLGITEYECGFTFREYTQAITIVTEKHDLVLLPNGTVLPRDQAEKLMK